MNTKIDITAPGKKSETGKAHILSKTIREFEDIFTKMGFEIASGPEVQSEHYNFDTLNVPKNHPSRDMQDTF
jgi:phenylalanyl-tRNA synthetase alpha chain